MVPVPFQNPDLSIFPDLCKNNENLTWNVIDTSFTANEVNNTPRMQDQIKDTHKNVTIKDHGGTKHLQPDPDTQHLTTIFFYF